MFLRTFECGSPFLASLGSCNMATAGFLWQRGSGGSPQGSKRADPNQQYLKNVVLQYLCAKDQEQAAGWTNTCFC